MSPQCADARHEEARWRCWASNPIDDQLADIIVQADEPWIETTHGTGWANLSDAHTYELEGKLQVRDRVLEAGALMRSAGLRSATPGARAWRTSALRPVDGLLLFEFDRRAERAVPDLVIASVAALASLDVEVYGIIDAYARAGMMPRAHSRRLP